MNPDWQKPPQWGNYKNFLQLIKPTQGDCNAQWLYLSIDLSINFLISILNIIQSYVFKKSICPDMNSPGCKTSQAGSRTWSRADPLWSACVLSWTPTLAGTRNAPTPSLRQCSPGTCTVRTGPESRPGSSAATTLLGGAWQVGGIRSGVRRRVRGATELSGEVKSMERWS